MSCELIQRIGIIFISVFLTSFANAALLTFDDVITGSTTYTFDGDGDAIGDVIFSTIDPLGFNTIGPGLNMTFINEPGLEGTSLLDTDLRVDFVNGAVGSLNFGFALNSFVSSPSYFANIDVYNSNGSLLGSSSEIGDFTNTNSPSGLSNYPEGYVSVGFSGIASYATLDFNSQFGRYIIDNFQGTFGSTENVPIAAHGFPLMSEDPVYLNTEAGGDNFLNGTTPTHTDNAAYYSLDFDVNSGEADVVASKAGEIVFIGHIIVNGNYVPSIVIDHKNGYYTQYTEFDTASNPSDAMVNVNPDLELGDWVNEGDYLAKLEAEPTSHLHYQVKYDPSGNGLGTGKSTLGITELADVSVGGRLIKDYHIPDPCISPCQAQVYGELNPLLPNVTNASNDAFNFNILTGNLGVGLNQPIFVDPIFAIGYDYEILNGPLFSSVLLPLIGDNLFELWLYDMILDDYTFSTSINAGDTYFFGGNGIDRFRILGIELSAALNPDDPTAFVTGLTFASEGNTSFSMSAVTQALPEPTTLGFWFIGLIGLSMTKR